MCKQTKRTSVLYTITMIPNIQNKTDIVAHLCNKFEWTSEDRKILFKELFQPIYNNLSQRGLKTKYWQEVSETLQEIVGTFAPSAEMIRFYCNDFRRIKTKNSKVIIITMMATLSEYIEEYYNFIQIFFPESITKIEKFIKNNL